MTPRRRELVAAFAACAAASVLLPGRALAAPATLLVVAARSVLAVEGPGGLRTAFAFGANQTLVVGSASSSAIALVAAGGDQIVADPLRRDGALSAARLKSGRVRPLRVSAIRDIRGGTPAFVLGPPLGYEPRRIREVRLASVRPAGTGTAHIAGTLPSSFRGAPVVTPAGHVLGAVGAVDARGWMFVPQARLRRLLTAAASRGGGGTSVLVLLAVALATALAAGAIVLTAIRRRRRTREAERAAREDVHPDAAPPRAPLVRRRGPAEEEEEDFEIVFRSHGDS